MSKTLHLILRSGVFYYKRRVPVDVREAFGAAMYQVSLETRSLQEAEKKRALQDMLFLARVEAARQQVSSAPALTSLSFSILEADIQARVRHFVAETDKAATKQFVSYQTEEERFDATQNIEIELDCLNAPSDPFGQQLIAEAYDEATGLAQPHPKAADMVQRGLVELRRRKLDRIRQGYAKAYIDPLFGPALPSDIIFKDLADQYLKFDSDEAKANNRRPHTSEKKAALVSTVVEMIGANTSIVSISYDVVQNFRVRLDQLPANRNKLFPGKTIDQAIDLAAKSGKPRLSYLAQADYSAQLRLILELAVKKQIIPHNFARDLRPLRADKVGDGERRAPLTVDQIKRLFASDFYAKSAELLAPYRADTKGGWRFWLPLMMLFAGMRPNEVCQLRTADLKITKAGVHYIDVTSEEHEQNADNLPAKSVKTRNSVRKVPIHPLLINIGLLSYLAERRDAGDIQLFPTLIPKAYGNYATYPARRFNERFLPDAVELAPDQALYSLRHSFRDALRRIDAPNDTLRALGGWADHSETSSDYGDRTDPDYQAKWVNQISYSDLDLTPLYQKATK